MSVPDDRSETAGPPALDKHTIDDLLRLREEYSNPQFLHQLVQIFTANAPRRMEQIRSAIAEGETRVLEHAAHTLKSNCAMLGASRMAGYCQVLEHQAEQGAFDEARLVLAQAEAEFLRVMEELGALVTDERATYAQRPPLQG